MANLNVGKQTKAEQEQALEQTIEQATANEETQVVERGGKKFLVRELNGFKIETRIA